MADEAITSVEDRLAQYFAPPAQKAAPTAQPSESEPPEAPVSEDQPPADVQEPEVSDQAEEQVSDAPPEGYVELEHLGKKYHVPPDLKTAFESNRALATKSAMEIAPVRKSLEIERIAMQAAKVADGELRELSQQQAQLNSYKEQAKKVDWAALTLDQKVDLDRELRMIDTQLSELDKQMSAKRSATERQFGEFVVAAVQETEKYMASKVPNWDVEKGKALHVYGQNQGYPTEKLTTGWFADPKATEIMWKAKQWDELQTSRPGVTNKASSAPPVIKPGSNQVQKSVATSNYQKVRQNLKKSGSLEDAARLFRMRMK